METYRLDLVLSREVLYNLEPIPAAMAVLKLYLGIDVPRVLRTKILTLIKQMLSFSGEDSNVTKVATVATLTRM